MTRKAYVTDLDGTLLRSDQSISDFTTGVINDLLEQDTVITFATARGSISADSVVSRISWKYPVILYNGALIYDWIDKKVIGGYWLDVLTTNVVIEIGSQHGITPLLFCLDKGDKERVLHEKLQRYGETEFVHSRKNDPRFTEVDGLECPPDHRTLALTYIGLKEELEPILNEVMEKLGNQVHLHMMKDYYIDNHYFLEISHPKANKKDGLKLWADHMHIDIQDIVIFGDHLNDLGLFEVGGTKVAVSNAQESILNLADHVIQSNNEDGVATYLVSKVGLVK
ncbi:Cof-type HAD-IIB family hydrolase [Paenibacillus sp. KN14-4R]|uniref:Cof-type HAD-IIB family hydrolase n=1 Tax=Paenibacillus sp. KN14-4R TaxID=3445773 RepID=UPI003F9EFF16